MKSMPDHYVNKQFEVMVRFTSEASCDVSDMNTVFCCILPIQPPANVSMIAWYEILTYALLLPSNIICCHTEAIWCTTYMNLWLQPPLICRSSSCTQREAVYFSSMYQIFSALWFSKIWLRNKNSSWNFSRSILFYILKCRPIIMHLPQMK
jgi:hypothetical protein